MQKKAIILFSSGLDSTTCVAIAKSQGFACYALSFDYGQKHQSELANAKRLADQLNIVEHKIVTLPIGEFGGSALTDRNIRVPDFSGDQTIPMTYVPARNTIFLAVALSWAEVIQAYDIFIGINAVDYSGYPDCRPEFLRAFETLADLATKVGVEGQHFKIHAPLIQFSKSDIIRLGLSLGVDYSMTLSCYRADSEGRACGSCDSCVHRKKGFMDVGVLDPTRYKK